MTIPKRVLDRFGPALKQMQPVLEQQRSRDVSEADTVTMVKDLLHGVFGYDKYSELTSEHSIRGTFCDLAVKVDGKLALLVEVKAIGIELKDSHIKQAIDYASNQGCEWVVLTNGIEWRLFHVLFKKPIDKEEVACFNILSANHRSKAEYDKLYLLTREGFLKSALSEYRDRQDATSRFVLSALILRSESVQTAIKREIRRVSGHVVEWEAVEKVLRDEVLKRETMEGDHADAAGRRISRTADRNITTKRTKAEIEAEAASSGEACPALPA